MPRCLILLRVTLTGKQMCAEVSFIMKVQGSWKFHAWIKSNFYVHILPDMFSNKICKILNNTFANTSNSVEHLRNRGRFFYGSKVHSLLIPFSKESMKVKKSVKSQSVRCMCHADTIVSHEIRDK